MAQGQTGTNPVPKPMMTQFADTYLCHQGPGLLRNFHVRKSLLNNMDFNMDFT